MLCRCTNSESCLDQHPFSVTKGLNIDASVTWEANNETDHSYDSSDEKLGAVNVQSMNELHFLEKITVIVMLDNLNLTSISYTKPHK